MFCNGKIVKGQRYFRQTNIIDGPPGDFICHSQCNEVAHQLGMYDDCDPDYGITDEIFQETIDQYIYDNHYDNEADDVKEEWQNLSRHEEVLKIYDELKSEKTS